MAVELRPISLDRDIPIDELVGNDAVLFVLWCIDKYKWVKRDFDENISSGWDLDYIVALLRFQGLLENSSWELTETGRSVVRQIAEREELTDSADTVDLSDWAEQTELAKQAETINAQFEIERELQQKHTPSYLHDYHQNPFNLTVLPLPSDSSSMQGREEVFTWLMERLRRKTPYVCVLNGVTGIGKTTFAAIAVRQLLEDGYFADGVAAVRCNDHPLLTDLVEEILTRLDKGERRPPKRGISPDKAALFNALKRSLRSLKNRDVLIVLDNAQFQDSLAAITDLLEEAGAKVLIIGANEASPFDKHEIGFLRPLSQNEAFWYFVKVYRSRGGASLKAKDVEAVKQVIKIIGGHPIVVQLTAAEAAQMRHDLSWYAWYIDREQNPQQHLTTSFHQELEERIQHLPTHISQCLTALGVFKTVEFSENALKDLWNSLNAGDERDMVKELVRWSIVQPEEIALPRGGDCFRLWLHGFLHGLAQARLERLPQTDREKIQRASINFYLDYLERVAELVRKGLLTSFEYEHIVERDRANIRGAIDHAIQLADDSAVLRLCSFMRGFWYNRRYMDECAKYLYLAVEAGDRLLEQSQSEEVLQLYSRVQFSFAQVQRRIGEIEYSKEILRKNLEIRQKLSDKGAEAETLAELSIVNRLLGKMIEAREVVQKSLDILQDRVDPRGEGQAYIQLGRLALWHGELEEARRHFKSSYSKAVESRDWKIQGDALLYLGQVDRQTGELNEAEIHLNEGRQIMEEIEDRSGIAFAFHQLAKVARVRGDYVLSQQLALQSLSLRRAISDRRGVGETLGHLSQIAREQGQLEAAEAYLLQSRDFAIQTHDRRGEGIVATQYGLLNIARGKFPLAKTHLAESLRIHQDVQDRRAEGADYGYLGGIALAEGNLELASELFSKCLSIAKSVEDREGESNVFAAQGLLAAKMGTFDRAESLIKKGMRIARHMQAYPQIAKLCLQLAQLYSECIHDISKGKRFAHEAIEALGNCTADPVGIRQPASAILAEKSTLPANVSVSTSNHKTLDSSLPLSGMLVYDIQGDPDGAQAEWQSLLGVPFVAGEEKEANFSFVVLADQEVAYDCKASGDWGEMLSILKHQRFHASGRSQQLRTLYLRGLARWNLGHSTAAERLFRAALTLVGPDTDTLTRALFHYHLAHVLHAQQRLDEASEENQTALQLLTHPDLANVGQSHKLRREIILRLASEQLSLYHLEEGLAYLDQSLVLLDRPYQSMPQAEKRQLINVLWMKALMLRWRNVPEAAYKNAKAALDVFAELNLASLTYRGIATPDMDTDVLAYARLELVAADCLLDFEERARYDQPAVSHLETARDLISDALRSLTPPSDEMAQQGKTIAHDQAGQILAWLTWRRYQRLAQFDNAAERLNDLHAFVDKVTKAADKDEALIGQACLTYADEFAYQGNTVNACIYYGLAVEHLDTVAPMLAMRARKALELYDVFDQGDRIPYSGPLS